MQNLIFLSLFVTFWFFFKIPCMIWMPMYGLARRGVTPCSKIIVGDELPCTFDGGCWGHTPFQNHGEIKTTVQVIWFRLLISFWGVTPLPL